MATGVGILRAALFLGLISGCAGPSVAVGSGYCAPPRRVPSITPEEMPPKGSSREEFTAALIGLRSELHEDVHDDKSRLLALERVQVARLAIDATAAELDCEAKRAGQAADLLAHHQQNTVQVLTIASIAAATAAGLGSVFAATTNSSAWTQNGVSIGGAAVTAGFGVASLYVRPTIRFEHPDNLLTDILRGPAQSASYPPVVWGYLTTPEFSNDQLDAIRTKLLQRWRHYQRMEADPGTIALLFGRGGDYDLDTLRVRAAMLEQVRSEVLLAEQEITVLVARLRER
ncbi:hypothetical protein AKJ09_10784 [Labilithrix luteola]|uniref:Lipoprotein n=1 Tax=Labilithrix luteola TaxID=1391654 RepID=A0A0K1QEC7_9BACT|nr:hypothetical protein [Labilithrix luteola]AKV04121.1 hypothetical protein AKJ09_10784 [Labilithrix luteola]